MRVASFAPAVALAIYAHPDDADVAAGGTMALWASQGCEVHLVVVCDGAKGSHAPQENGGALADIRRSELQAAADILGIAAIHTLGFADGDVTNSADLREQLVTLIRAVQPSIVIGPDPTATFFGGVYVNHRDHRETGWAVLDAVAPAAAMPLYFPAAGPAFVVSTLLLSGTHEPDVAIAIDAAIDQKVAAVLAHASQMGNEYEGIAQAVRSRASQAGRTVGVAHAEAFRCVEFSS